jgi:hypothetical protein
MRITLNKFGLVLTSRQAGREALGAFKPSLKSLEPKEQVILDFTGVSALSPSWADEFITPLHKTYGDRLRLAPVDNSSVDATLQILKIKLSQP